MPITGDAAKVKKSMTDQYGKEKGERVFYATANKQDRTPETWKKKKDAAPTAAEPLPLRQPKAPVPKTPLPAVAKTAASSPADVVRFYLLRDIGRKTAAALDLLPGGIADGMPDSAFDPEQLDEGIETEMEHVDNPAFAKEIAKDHLAEEGVPPAEQIYYDELEDMEEGMHKEAMQTLGMKVAAAMGIQTLALADQPGPVSSVPGVEPPKQLVPQSQTPGQAPAPAGGTAPIPGGVPAAPIPAMSAGGRPSTGSANPATGAPPQPQV